jgi:hypothetical protein
VLAIVFAAILISGNSYLIDKTEAKSKVDLVKIAKWAKTNSCAGAKSFSNKNCKTFESLNKLSKETYTKDSGSGKFLTYRIHYFNPNDDNIVREYGDKTASEYILLWGDSHAKSYIEVFDYIARKMHLKLISGVKSSCNFNVSGQDCVDYNQYIIDHYVNKAKFIVVADLANNMTKQRYIDHLIKLSAINKTIYYMQDQPPNNTEMLKCLAKTNANECKQKRSIALSSLIDSDNLKTDFISQSELIKQYSPNVKLIKTEDIFCDNEYCYLALGGLYIKCDNHHFTYSFVLTLNDIIYERFLKSILS